MWFTLHSAMASILDEYEDSQNTRRSAQRPSRSSTTNVGIPHTGDLGCSMEVETEAILIAHLIITPTVPVLGFVNVRLEEEKPIFNKQRVDFTPPEKINHLVVCNNQLCMNLGKDSLLRQILQLMRMMTTHLYFNLVTWESSPLRIDLTKPDQRNQIELGRKDDSTVHRLFLDPTGEKNPADVHLPFISPFIAFSHMQ